MKILRFNPFLRFFRHLFASSAIVMSFFTAASANAAEFILDTNGATSGFGDYTGNWDLDAIWSTSFSGSVEPITWVDGNSAVFNQSNPGTVTIAGTVATPSISYLGTGAQTLTGGSIDMGPSAGLTIDTSAAGSTGGSTKTIASQITGTGALTIIASGDLSATGGGSNTHLWLSSTTSDFTGDITITKGLLGWADPTSLGNAANNLTLDGGGIVIPTSKTIARNLAITGNGGTIRPYGAATVTLTGALSSTAPGALVTHTDGGILILQGDGSAFDGVFSHLAGTSRFVSQDWSNTDLEASNGGRVEFTSGQTSKIGSITTSRDVDINNGTILDITSGTLNLDVVSGLWVQSRQGVGYLTSSSGELYVTNGQAFGSLTTTDHQIQVVITDPSGMKPLSLEKTNLNTLVLTAANTYTNGTFVTGGALIARNSQAFGTGLVSASLGGQARIETASTLSNNFSIADFGPDNDGAIRLGNGSTIAGQVTLDGSASITTNGSATISGAVSSAATDELEINSATNAGTLTLADASGVTGGIYLRTGVLNVGDVGSGVTLATNSTLNLSGTVAGNVVQQEGSSLRVLNGGDTAAPLFDPGALRILEVAAGGTLSSDLTVTEAAPVALTIGGTVTGNVTLGEGSSLTSTGGTITGNLSVGLDSESNTPWNVLTPLNVTGNVTLNGTQTIDLLDAPKVGQPFVVLAYNGALNGGAANFELLNPTAFRNASITDSGSQISVNAAVGNRTWAGNDSTNPTHWDAGLTANWAEGDHLFFNGDEVLFNDAASSFTVQIQGTLSPAEIEFANSTNTYTVGGPGLITGTTGIVKNGTGRVNLGGGNGQDFTGAINVNAGTLAMASRDAFGQASAINIAPGGTVDINGQTPGTIATGGYDYFIAGSGATGAGALTNTGTQTPGTGGVKNLTLTGDATIGGTNRYDIGLSVEAGFGTLTGNGYTLTKVGTGSVLMRGTASASPIHIMVNEGSLVAQTAADGFGGLDSTVQVNSGGRVGTYGTLTIQTPTTINDGGTLYNDGAGAGEWTNLTLMDGATIDTPANWILLSGSTIHSGSGAIAKTGASELKIIGSLIGSGGTLNHNAGTIEIGNNTPNGSISGFSQINLAPAMLFRNRLNGANLTIDSDFDFAGPASELRQHGGSASDTLTLGGAVGTDPSVGRVTVRVGNIVLAPGSSMAAGELVLGSWNGGEQAYLTIQPGSTLDTRYLNIGDGGNALFTVNQTGGTVTVHPGGYGVRVGHWAGANRQYNLSGGTLNALPIVANGGSAGVVNIGWDGQGLMTVGGGTSEALLQASGLQFSQSNANRLTVLPNGVVEIATRGTGGTGANGFMVLDGGTVRGIESSTWAANVQVLSDSSIEALANTRVNQTGTLTGTADIEVMGDGAIGFTNLAGYLGRVNVPAGNVYLTGTVNDFTIDQGSSLRIGVVAAPNSVGALTVSATGNAVINGDVFFDLDAVNPNSPAQDMITIADGGNVSFGPNAVVRPSFFGGTLAEGEYVLFGVNGTRTGMPSVDDSTVRFNLALQNGVAPFEDDVMLVVSGEAGDLTWVGDGTANVWELDGAENWLIEGAPTKFMNYDAVSFTDAGNNTVPIQITGELNPTGVTVDAAKDYTFAGSGSIAGSLLNKAGTGTLTLLNLNSFTGGTLAGGSILVGDTGSLGTIGTLATSAGTQLTLDKSGDVNFGMQLTGDGHMVKTGAGIVRLTTQQQHTGGTTVEGGVLSLSGGGGVDGTIRGKVDVLAGASLHLNTGDATGYGGGAGSLTEINLLGGNLHNNSTANQTLGNAVVNMTGATITGITGSTMDFFAGAAALNTLASDTTSVISGTRIVLRQGPGVVFTVADGTTPSGIDLEISSRLTNAAYGNNPLTKAGDGTMKITGTENNYGGNTIVNAGVLDLTAGNLYTGGYYNAAVVTVKTGATLIVNSLAYNETAGSVASLGGLRDYANARVLDGGTLVVTHGTHSFGNNFSVTAAGGTLRYEPADPSNTVTFQGNANSNMPINGALTVDAIGNITVQEVIEGSGSIVKIGDGKLTIESASTIAGNLTVSEGAFELAQTGSLVFNVTGSGVSKTISGAGSAAFNGRFIVDLTNAPTAEGSSWVLANVANQTFGSSFSLVSGGTPFTETAGVHTFVNGATTYTFTEATGVLSIGEAAPAEGYEDWAAQITDPGQRGRGDDPDGDGFTNLQEYLFGSDPSANNGSLVTSARDGNNLVIRWNELNAGGSYLLQESGTLMGGSWTLSTAVPAADSNQAGVPADYTRMKAVVPITGNKRFFRVEADEN